VDALTAGVIQPRAIYFFGLTEPESRERSGYLEPEGFSTSVGDPLGRPLTAVPWRAVLDCLGAAVGYIGTDGLIAYWNGAAEQLTGRRAVEMLGQPGGTALAEEDDQPGGPGGQGRESSLGSLGGQDGQDGQSNRGGPIAAAVALTLSDGEPRSVEQLRRGRTGERRPLSLELRAVRDPGGSIIGATVVLTDLAPLQEIRQLAAEARHQAETDSPTGLSNRRAFDQAIGGRVENMRRYGSGFGLLVIDVDHFKLLNLRWGHAAADRALQRFAQTAARCTRAGDLLARWGGDEFVMLVEQVDEAGLQKVAERLRLTVNQARMMVDGHRITLRISVGGAVMRASDTSDSLFRRADQAMFAAKAAGGDQTIIAEDEQAV
jgi:diguanylate cyclase (GGDEF)-like protein